MAVSYRDGSHCTLLLRDAYASVGSIARLHLDTVPLAGARLSLIPQEKQSASGLPEVFNSPKGPFSSPSLFNFL